jgi:heme/copper-type cytochrome/quinol oxidase subunit 2
MEAALETQAISILGTIALVLMVVVTGGVVYLTAIDWRDRRRRKRDQESTQVGSKKQRRAQKK